MGGAPAARGCPIEERKLMFLEELALLGAARLREGGGCFGGSSRCAGLPLIERGRRLLWGELSLRGAAR